MGVSKNRCTAKSSILIGFSIINHPFWDTPIFGNPYLKKFFLAKNNDMISQQTFSRLLAPGHGQKSLSDTVERATFG